MKTQRRVAVVRHIRQTRKWFWKLPLGVAMALGGGIGALAGMVGCQSSPARTAWDGPQTAQPVRSEPWQYRETAGKTVITPHYQIHTTIADDDTLERLAQVMEGALQQYQRLAPEVK